LILRIWDCSVYFTDEIYSPKKRSLIFGYVYQNPSNFLAKSLPEISTKELVVKYDVIKVV
jgi:hypothetical protein